MYERVPVKNLLHKHQDYLELKEAWECLHDMERGAPAILKRKEYYLPRKHGESNLEYQNRLLKLAYTPHLSNAIRETTAKLAAAPMHVENADSDYWAHVRKHIDGRQMDEDKFIREVFSSFCYYGRVFVCIDRDPIPFMPLSRGEQLSMLYSNKLYPKARILHPLCVTDWNLDQDWFVITMVGEQYRPLEAPRTVATWKLYTPMETWTYQAEVKLREGQISTIWVDRPELEGGGTWVSVNDPDIYIDGVVVEHGLGVNPIVYSVLKEEAWVGGMTYMEQIQHLRVKSQLAEAAYIAGTVVRVFTPTPPQERSPKALLEGTQTPPPKADHSHTLIGANYQFVESTGAAIDNLLKVLQDSEEYIQSVASLDYKRKDTKQVQSADSKQVDTSIVEDVMKMMGTECKAVYQGTLDRFSLMDGQEGVAVQGLENYGTDTLDQMLLQSQSIEALESAQRVPETALKMWYSRLANLIAGNTFGATEKQLQDELEQLFAKAKEEDPQLDVETIKGLMDTYGLTMDEAAHVITGDGDNNVEG